MFVNIVTIKYFSVDDPSSIDQSQVFISDSTPGRLVWMSLKRFVCANTSPTPLPRPER